MSSKLNSKACKKLFTILGGALICIVFLSCENFLNAQKISRDIQDAIAYNNAEEINVIIQPQEGTGSTLPAGIQKIKKGYNFDISFTENPAYSFVKWIAVSNEDPSTQITEGVSFENAASLSTKVKITNTSVYIKLLPLCEERIAVSGEPSPRYDPLGVSRDRSIIVTFTKEPSPKSFIFSEEEIPDGAQTKTDEDGNIWAYIYENQTFFKNISITNIDDYSIARYFNKPQVNGKLLTIAVDKTNPIEFNSGEIYKTIKVTLSKEICDVQNIKMNAAKSWNYQITESTDEKASVNLSCLASEGSVYLAGSKDYSIGQKINLIFTENAEFQFVKWDYDPEIIYVADPQNKNTTATILEKTKGSEATQVKPLCAPRLKVTDFAPVNDSQNQTVSKNSSIVLTFNQNIPFDEENLKQLENITIAIGGALVKSSFKAPSISGNTVTFIADNSNMIDVPAGQTKTVSVSIPADFYYLLEDGTKVTYGGNGFSFDYKIDETTLKRAEITFKAQNGSGTLTAKDDKYSIGQEVPFSFAEADDWKFSGWYITSGGEPVSESQIFIADKNALSTKLIVYEAVQGVTVTAEAYRVFKEIEHFPKNNTLSPQDSDIEINFNKEIDQEFLEDFWNYFTITCDGIDVKDYFIAPSGTENDEKTIHIKTDKTKDLIPVDSSTSKIVNVSYKDIKEKSMEGNILNQQTLSSSFSYIISNSKDQIIPIINEIHVYKDASMQEELSSLPFASWKAENYPQNHTKSLYVTIRGSDNSGELKAVRATETYLKNPSGDSVTTQTNTTEVTDFNYQKAADGSIILKFLLNFKNIDDGLYSVNFTIVDWADNESLTSGKTYYMIKDTVLGLSDLSFGTDSNINQKRTDENGIDTVYFSFTDSGKKETYYSSYKDELTINGIYWGYEKNNLSEIIPVDEKYTIVRNAYKVTYIKIIIEDCVGNLQENYIVIPPKAIIDRIELKDAHVSGESTKCLQIYSRKFYTDVNSYSNNCYLDLETKDNSINFSDSLMNMNEGDYVYHGILGVGDNNFNDENNFKTEFYAKSYYKLTYIKSLVVYGCISDMFTYFRNVPNTYPEPAEADIPYSVRLSYDTEKIKQNDGFIEMQHQFVDENQEVYNPSLSNEYSYVIKAESGSNSYVYNLDTVTLISGYNYKIYSGIRDSYGNQKFRSNYTICNLESIDNSSPVYDIRAIQNVNLGYSPGFVTFSFYTWPTDKSGLLSDGDNVKFKCFYIPLKEFKTISLTPDEIEAFSCKEIKFSKSMYNKNGGYIPIPFDGRDEGYYNIYVKLEDASEFHNCVYIPLLVSNVCNNIIPCISKTDSGLYVSLPTTESYKNNVGFTVHYYDDGIWKIKKNSSYYFFSVNIDNENETQYNLSSIAGDLSGKFVRVGTREGSIFSSKSSGNLRIFYFDYYTSNIVCKRKNIIPEGLGGIEIICDQPTLVHTMYCSVNLGNDPTTWITKGMETGIQTSSETFTYSNSNFSDIPDSYYYTTIAHFADGTMLMTNVKQK